MNEALKRALFLMEFDISKELKINEERANLLYESKATQLEGSMILRKGGVEESKINKLMAEFSDMDETNNQVLIPVIATAYLEYKDINSLAKLFMGVAELIKKNELGKVFAKDGKYYANDKHFNNFIQFSEYIHGLESIAHGYSYRKTGLETAINVDTSANAIADSNGIKVYDGNEVGRCIKYTMGGLTGHKYGFCIGQPNNSMWQSYRDTKTSTFYYVVDGNRPFEDPLHIVVVDNTRYGIELTDANNTTGTISEYDKDVNGYMNYLKGKGIDVDIFKNKEKTPEEEKEQEILKETNPSLEWFTSLGDSPEQRFDYQSKYIGRGHLLSDEQFNYLWVYRKKKGAFFLLTQYVDTGQAIPESQLKTIATD